MRNVLICEDNLAQRRPMAVVLERAGFRPVFATSLQAAREVLVGDEVLVALVTDLHLKDGNGFDLLIDVRQHRPTLPVIVVTGDYTPDLVRLAEGEGVRAVLPKPLDYTKLLEALA